MMIQYLPTEGMAGCKKAVAPIVFQFAQTLTAGEGSTPVVAADVAADAPAYYGGYITNKGCHDLEVTMQYLTGDDCDACTTPDALSLVEVVLTVPANSNFPLPNGYWQDMEFVTLDSSGNPVDLSGTNVTNVNVYSAYTPECPNCAVVAV